VSRQYGTRYTHPTRYYTRGNTITAAGAPSNYAHAMEWSSLSGNWECGQQAGLHDDHQAGRGHAARRLQRAAPDPQLRTAGTERGKLTSNRRTSSLGIGRQTSSGGCSDHDNCRSLSTRHQH